VRAEKDRVKIIKTVLQDTVREVIKPSGRSSRIASTSATCGITASLIAGGSECGFDLQRTLLSLW
jgi:hypothetical protein